MEHKAVQVLKVHTVGFSVTPSCWPPSNQPWHLPVPAATGGDWLVQCRETCDNCARNAGKTFVHEDLSEACKKGEAAL